MKLAALEEEVKLMSYRLLEQEEKRKAEIKAAQRPPTPELVVPIHDPRKIGGGRQENRLRVSLGESGRRPRQISIEGRLHFVCVLTTTLIYYEISIDHPKHTLNVKVIVKDS